jgi:hypothetical protein
VHIGRASLSIGWRPAALWEDKGTVFTSPIGTPLEPRNVTREFRAILVAAKLPAVRFS